MQCCAADRATCRRQQGGRGEGVWILLLSEVTSFENKQGVYEYEISSVLSSARAWPSVILARKHDSRRHSSMSFSENVVVSETSYQMLEVLSLWLREGLTSFNKDKGAFLGCLPSFWEYARKL